jgi:hypothetical protein
MKLINRQFLKSAALGVKGGLTHLRLSRRGLGKIRWTHRAGFGTVFNLFTKVSGKKPDKDIYNLMQSFKNYIMVADPILDSAHYNPRIKRVFTTRDLKKIELIKADASEFVKQLNKMNLPREKKKAIIKCFSDFRRRVIKGINRTMKDPFVSKEEALLGIKETVGDFLGTSAEMAGICYDLEKKKVSELREVFEVFGTSLQLRDDMRDYSLDYGIVQNSFVSIAMSNRREFELIKSMQGKKLSKEWIRTNMPNSLMQTTATFEQILRRMPSTNTGNKIAQVCRDAYYGL